MKHVKEKLYEKFEESSDPVEDMGIGVPEIRELKKNYQKLGDYINFNIEDLDFSDVIYTLEKLKNIIMYTVIFYFNQKYKLNIEIRDSNNTYNAFGVAKIQGYILEFYKSNSGMSIAIRFWKNRGNFSESTPQCKSIRRLEAAFLKICKKSGISLK